jgi:signal peptidase I
MDTAHAIKCELACESLVRSGSLRLKVNGWSMIPTIWPDDVLMISRISDEDIQIGRIALYRRNHRIFVHRVVVPQYSGDTERVLLRGDCMPQADPPVPVGDLLGKLDFIVRNGRTIKPSQSASLAHRAAASLVRRSKMGARAVFGVRRIYRVLRFSKSRWVDQLCQL